MAKRFTDTDKWRKPWFRKLSAEAKLAWVYLTDNCDNAGVWPAAYDLMSSDLGIKVSGSWLANAFGDRVQIFADKVFLPSFIEFQYGRLSEDSSPHQAVIRLLEKHAIDIENLYQHKGYPKGIETLKDKDKDKDKNNKGECEGIFTPSTTSSVQSAQDLADAVPLLQRERFAKKYPDPKWVLEETENCFNFHIADPGKRPTTTGQWMRKLESWLLSRWAQRPRLDQSEPIDWSKYK